MMKIYASIFFLFLLCSLRGQGVIFEKSINYGYSQKGDCAALISNSLIVPVTVNQANSYFTGGLLHSFDKNGNINWTRNIATNGMEALAYSKVIETKDTNILLLTSGVACCDCGGGYRELSKIDMNGSLIWSKLISASSFSAYTNHLNLIELPNGRIIYNNQVEHPLIMDYYFITDEFGNIEDSISYTHNQPIQTVALNANNFASATIDKVYKYNTATGLTDSLNIFTPIMDIESWSDTLVISTINSIQLYDFNFQLINSVNLPNVSWREGLKIDSTRIRSFALLTQGLAIIDLDHNLVPMDTVIYTDTLIDHLYGCYDDTSMYTLSNMYLNSNNYQAIKMLGFNNNLNGNSKLYDISLSKVNVTDFAVDYIQNMSYNLYSMNPEIDITVVNNMTDTLHSLKVTCRRGSGICNDWIYDGLQSNLNIAPGDSLVLPIGFVGFGERININDGATVGENLCVTVSSPNGHFDNKVEDNSLCEYYAVGYGNVSEVNRMNVKLYPNPSNGKSILQFENEFKGEVLIFNVLGELVKSYNIFNSRTLDIDVEDLVKGMYPVKIIEESEHTSVVNLIVE